MIKPYQRPCSFTEFVNRLTKSPEDLLKTTTARHLDWHHMITGLTGEVGELITAIRNRDRRNIIEECGDLRFYWTRMAAGRMTVNLRLTDAYYNGTMTHVRPPLVVRVIHGLSQLLIGSACTTVNESLSDCLHLSEALGELADALKRCSIYCKADDPDWGKVDAALFDFIVYLRDIERRYGWTVPEVEDRVFIKLQTRYQGLTYTDRSANTRADKTLEEQTDAKAPV